MTKLTAKDIVVGALYRGVQSGNIYKALKPAQRNAFDSTVFVETIDVGPRTTRSVGSKCSVSTEFLEPCAGFTKSGKVSINY